MLSIEQRVLALDSECLGFIMAGPALAIFVALENYVKFKRLRKQGKGLVFLSIK